MPGRVLHVPGGRDLAPAQAPVGGRGRPGADGVPRRALERGVPAVARRPAAAGLAGRLDLPGRAGRGAPSADRTGPASRSSAARSSAARSSAARSSAARSSTARSRPAGDSDRTRDVSEQLHTSPVDVIVLGAGMAGLVAAVRLAEAGLRVTTVAKGYGSLRLSPPTIDILGYRPDPVDSPAQALPGFAAAHPEHPYAQISPALLAEAVQWLKEHVETYAYVGDPDANMLLPTALGVPRPSAVVPETMASGDRKSAGPLLIAGIGVLKDFHPALVAENLEAATAARGRAVRARPVLLNPPTDGDADVGALALARRFEDAAFRAAVVAELRAAVTGDEAIGLPAVLGLDQARSVWAELQQATGRPVFEIPTPVPPSVPGLRLARALQDPLRPG